MVEGQSPEEGLELRSEPRPGARFTLLGPDDEH